MYAFFIRVVTGPANSLRGECEKREDALSAGEVAPARIDLNAALDNLCAAKSSECANDIRPKWLSNQTELILSEIGGDAKKKFNKSFATIEDAKRIVELNLKARAALRREIEVARSHISQTTSLYSELKKLAWPRVSNASTPRGE